MKPNKERIQKLVDALRSGEFEQTNYCLRKGTNAFCCLGVACEIFRRETAQGAWERHGFRIDEILEDVTLPGSVQCWFGFSSDNPIIGNEEDGINKSAISQNDTLRLPFATIADRFEATYLQPEPAE